MDPIRTILLTALVSCGCAHGKTIDGTLNGIEAGAVGLDVVVDQIAEQWSDYVNLKIAACDRRVLDTHQERKQCLGVAAEGDKVEKLMQSIRDGQADLVRILAAIREAHEDVAPLIEEMRQ